MGFVSGNNKSGSSPARVKMSNMAIFPFFDLGKECRSLQCFLNEYPEVADIGNFYPIIALGFSFSGTRNIDPDKISFLGLTFNGISIEIIKLK
jgi:hypothetical protein